MHTSKLWSLPVGGRLRSLRSLPRIPQIRFQSTNSADYNFVMLPVTPPNASALVNEGKYKHIPNLHTNLHDIHAQWHKWKAWREIFTPYYEERFKHRQEGERVYVPLWDIAPGCILWIPQTDRAVLQSTKPNTPQNYARPFLVIAVNIEGPSKGTVIVIPSRSFRNQSVDGLSGLEAHYRATFDPNWFNKYIRLRPSLDSYQWSFPPSNLDKLVETVYLEHRPHTEDWTLEHCFLEMNLLFAVSYRELQTYTVLHWNAWSRSTDLDGWELRLDESSFLKVCARIGYTPGPWLNSGPEIWKNFVDKTRIDRKGFDLTDPTLYDPRLLSYSIHEEVNYREKLHVYFSHRDEDPTEAQLSAQVETPRFTEWLDWVPKALKLGKQPGAAKKLGKYFINKYQKYWAEFERRDEMKNEVEGDNEIAAVTGKELDKKDSIKRIEKMESETKGNDGVESGTGKELDKKDSIKRTEKMESETKGNDVVESGTGKTLDNECSITSSMAKESIQKENQTNNMLLYEKVFPANKFWSGNWSSTMIKTKAVDKSSIPEIDQKERTNIVGSSVDGNLITLCDDRTKTKLKEERVAIQKEWKVTKRGMEQMQQRRAQNTTESSAKSPSQEQSSRKNSHLNKSVSSSMREDILEQEEASRSITSPEKTDAKITNSKAVPFQDLADTGKERNARKLGDRGLSERHQGVQQINFYALHSKNRSSHSLYSGPNKSHLGALGGRPTYGNNRMPSQSQQFHHTARPSLAQKLPQPSPVRTSRLRRAVISSNTPYFSMNMPNSSSDGHQPSPNTRTSFFSPQPNTLLKSIFSAVTSKSNPLTREDNEGKERKQADTVTTKSGHAEKVVLEQELAEGQEEVVKKNEKQPKSPESEKLVQDLLASVRRRVATDAKPGVVNWTNYYSKTHYHNDMIKVLVELGERVVKEEENKETINPLPVSEGTESLNQNQVENDTSRISVENEPQNRGRNVRKWEGLGLMADGRNVLTVSRGGVSEKTKAKRALRRRIYTAKQGRFFTIKKEKMLKESGFEEEPEGWLG
ncbi:hypothetical protein ACMFMG_011499 [Clarireedia jacksonii]